MYKFPGTVVYHVAKHRDEERTGNSGRAVSDETLVSFIDTLLLTKYRRDVAERSFWKALRVLARESFDQPSTSVPSAENDNG